MNANSKRSEIFGKYLKNSEISEISPLAKWIEGVGIKTMIHK